MKNTQIAGAVDYLSEKREQEIRKKIIPYLEKRILEMHEKGMLPESQNSLKEFLRARTDLSVFNLASLLSELAPQHVFSGEVPVIYEHLGLEYRK